MKQKLLIIDKNQFGSLTDSYKWCEHLRGEYDITVLCIESTREKVEMPDVKVEYVNFKLPYILRAILFTVATLWKVCFFKGKILVEYYPMCSILKRVFRNKRMHVDVRTLSVSKDERERKRFNRKIRRDCSCFDSISAISQGVADELNLPNVTILPLGSDVISETKKDYCTDIRLLYVGGFLNRNFEQTLQGYRQFIDRNLGANIHYDIVGYGSDWQLNELKRQARDLNLDEYLTFHGYIPHSKLKPFFDSCNVGICYVPIVSYYQHQPPTKTYEYILSGLFCIATGTEANRELITSENGLIIEDTPESFCNGLEKFMSMRECLDESKIRKSLEFGLWKSIVNEKLKPLLREL